MMSRKPTWMAAPHGDTAPEAPAAPCYSTRNQEVPDLEDLLKLVAGEEDVAPKKNEDDPVTLAAALAEATSCLGRPAKTFSELAGLVWKLLRHLRCGPNGVGPAKARPLNWHQLAEMQAAELSQGSQARTSSVAAWRFLAKKAADALGTEACQTLESRELVLFQSPC